MNYIPLYFYALNKLYISNRQTYPAQCPECMFMYFFIKFGESTIKPLSDGCSARKLPNKQLINNSRRLIRQFSESQIDAVFLCMHMALKIYFRMSEVINKN